MVKPYYLLQEYEALGTVWYIELFSDIETELYKEIHDRMVIEIEDFQKKYSRFNKDSLLNLLNKEGRVDFDQELYEMIQAAELWREVTQGVFDIGIKNDLERKGYGIADLKEVVQATKTQTTKSRLTGGRALGIQWNSSNQIDLGGLGKGYLIDKLSYILQNDYGLKYFLINGGGDIYVTSNQGAPVELLLEHPVEPNLYIGKVCIANVSLCVSSSYKRSWIHEGRVYNHFIDTNNGQTIQAASYVIADNTCKADILATVLALLAEYPEKIELLLDSVKFEYLTIDHNKKMHMSPIFKKAVEEL